MELVKQQLNEQGYTYFNMKDYDMFSEDLEYYSKYICNESTNLKEHIKGIRLDGVAKLEFADEFPNGKPQFNESFPTWEETKAKMDILSMKMDEEQSFQKWYHATNHDINEDFKKLVNKIIKELYDISENATSHNSSITYYEPGCFLKKHQDGYTNGRICVVLIYLNDSDYKPEWGGNLTFNDTNTIAPLFGNIAVLDFQNHNAFHEVKKVIDGYGRYAFLDFVAIKEGN